MAEDLVAHAHAELEQLDDVLGLPMLCQTDVRVRLLHFCLQGRDHFVLGPKSRSGALRLAESLRFHLLDCQLNLV